MNALNCTPTRTLGSHTPYIGNLVNYKNRSATYQNRDMKINHVIIFTNYLIDKFQIQE